MTKYMMLMLLLAGCACNGPGSDAWQARCKALGGHDYVRSAYKSSLHLCLAADGRIIELTDYQ